jgi:formylmethanofuran dehydrogenase subunit D
VKAIMISGRTLAQGACCESKMSTQFFKAVSICSLSEKDFSSLELSEGQNILVKSAYGSTVLSTRSDAGLPEGLIFIPMGPWANAITGPDTGGCGTPQFKGIEVEIEATDLPVRDVRQMFAGIEEAAR